MGFIDFVSESSNSSFHIINDLVGFINLSSQGLVFFFNINHVFIFLSVDVNILVLHDSLFYKHWFFNDDFNWNFNDFFNRNFDNLLNNYFDFLFNDSVDVDFLFLEKIIEVPVEEIIEVPIEIIVEKPVA